MNDLKKLKFVRELKKKYPSVYGKLTIEDSLIIHKLRKQRGKE